MHQVIGRKKELALLKSLIESDKSEFVAVYGRRRVGKTFLIRQATGDKFTFFVTGMDNSTKKNQLINFAIALQVYSGSQSIDVQDNWLLAFYKLRLYLGGLPEGPKVVFIDELPWMDGAKSGFIPALENFWNNWASLRDDIKLIVCGSATSWMINNLIRSKGGLHNRLTCQIMLEPFTLAECEEYFRTYGFSYSRRQIAETYMAMGGIPYYLSMMDKSRSVAQNIDRLFFAKDALLRNEFQDLYQALFKNAKPHIQVVTALAEKGIGMERRELVTATGLNNNGALSVVLEELEQCGFIRSYQPFGHAFSSVRRRQSRETVYQLMDFYTLFWFKFIKGNTYGDKKFWSLSLNSPVHNTWAGLSFEILCLSHVRQIKQALGIAGVQTSACCWHDAKAQIDLLIDRKDETVNLCEIKYSKGKYEISQTEADKLISRMDTFAKSTGTKKSLLLTMITTEGVKRNVHSDIVQVELSLDDLFLV